MRVLPDRADGPAACRCTGGIGLPNRLAPHDAAVPHPPPCPLRFPPGTWRSRTRGIPPLAQFPRRAATEPWIRLAFGG